MISSNITKNLYGAFCDTKTDLLAYLPFSQTSKKVEQRKKLVVHIRTQQLKLIEAGAKAGKLDHTIWTPQRLKIMSAAIKNEKLQDKIDSLKTKVVIVNVTAKAVSYAASLEPIKSAATLTASAIKVIADGVSDLGDFAPAIDAAHVMHHARKGLNKSNARKVIGIAKPLLSTGASALATATLSMAAFSGASALGLEASTASTAASVVGFLAGIGGDISAKYSCNLLNRLC
jgi:hypothetical protein